MTTFNFDLCELPPEAQKTRAEIRDFLERELGDRSASKRALSWGGFDREFSRKLGGAVAAAGADRLWHGITAAG